MVIGSRTQGVFFQGKKEEEVEKLPRANVRVPGATALKSPMPYPLRGWSDRSFENEREEKE